MIEKIAKIKIYLKRAALLASLSLIVFFAAFYLVNLDISPTREMSPTVQPAQEVNSDEEIKSRIGSADVSFAGFADWAQANGLNNVDVYDGDPDGDKLPNYLEYIHGTDPNRADTDGDGFSDSQEIANGYDPDAPGDTKLLVYLRIDKINVEAPMVWSLNTDEKNMLSELERGVSHFWKTAAPGQVGNMIVSGHSSNYIWAKGDYNHVFANLNDLENGDAITVKTIQKNGRIIIYHYAVNDKFVTAPDDEKIFATNQNQTLTLSTCWPLGTTFRRLIIKADITK